MVILHILISISNLWIFNPHFFTVKKFITAPEEAVEYGLIDKVYTSRADIK